MDQSSSHPRTVLVTSKTDLPTICFKWSDMLLTVNMYFEAIRIFLLIGIQNAAGRPTLAVENRVQVFLPNMVKIDLETVMLIHHIFSSCRYQSTLR